MSKDKQKREKKKPKKESCRPVGGRVGDAQIFGGALRVTRKTTAHYVNSNLNATFAGTMTWRPASRTITIAFGTVQTGATAILGGISATKQAKLDPPAERE